MQEELHNDKHPHLSWIHFVAPDVPLPVGNMTIYSRENHVRLFRRGETDARDLLGDLLGEDRAQ